MPSDRAPTIVAKSAAGGYMGIVGGLSVVILMTALAIWFNDNVPVGEYIADEIPENL